MNPFFSFRHQTRNQARKHLKFHFPWAFFVFNLGLCLFLFWSILFGDQQTCFRDESHFHYPLFRYIQTELSAGRFPLWTPYDNIGQPFFANASIGILYPGRLIFFLPFDFALLYSWYIAGHVFLATLTIYHLMRSWRISLWGATLGALSYGFCGTVFGQYCNPTFLVGAAWVPEAILWADRTMTRCSFRNALICAAFLSVILLVGDPQGAFHVGLAASLLALFRWRRERVLLKTNGAVLDNVSLPPSSSPIFSLRSLAGLVRNRIVLLGIIAGTTFLFSAVQILSSGEYARLCDRTGYKNPRSVWEIPAFLLADEKNLVKDEILFDDTAVSTRQSADVSRLTRRQRIFNGIFQRGFLDAHQVNSYNFSTHPLNFVAFIWSNITGRNFPQNTAWFGTVFRYIKSPDWHFTLYAGIVPFLLAVLMLRFRLRPVQNIRIIWFSWLFVIALLGGIGYYGLGWMLTFCFGIPSEQNPVTAPVGGVYWLMQVLIPGYIQFRYAPKLLTFAACPMAVLAGYGFDLLLLNFVQKATNSDSIKLDCFRLLKYFKRFAVVIIFISILLLLPASMQSEWNNLATKIPSGEFNGTFKADLAQKQVIGSLIQTISVLFSVLLLLRYRTYISATVFSVILLGIVAADLYISCSPTLFVMDRSFYYENHPEFLKRIERPDDFMPIRIHQNIKPPPRWRWESSPNRETEFRIYERRLMQMQHHYDAPRNHFGNLPIAKAIEPGTTSPYSYTAWVRKNIRNDYRFENNLMFIGVEYVLMDVSRPLDPNLADMLVHPDQAGISTDWSENTVLWRLKNPRQRTWIERENAKEENEGENHDTKNYNKETQKAEHEFSRIIHYEPNHLIIEAKLLESGTVVLSDQFWPGWKLWIETLSDDGREVISSVSGNIRPVEGIFRGVDLSAGHFRLIYRYVPDSFWRGAILSGISWFAFLMLLLIGFFVPQKKKYSVLK